jgi:acetyl-CoA carboxylase carboxyl transferase subunit beta
MEYSFIGGSMGVVVGEKIARGVEMALDAASRSSSFPARGRAHDGGRLSLMQMAKVSAALPDSIGRSSRSFRSSRIRRREA